MPVLVVQAGNIPLNKAKQRLLSKASVGWSDHGNFSHHIKSVCHPFVGGRDCKDDVSDRRSARASDLSASARQRLEDRPSVLGQTVCPFSVGSVFDASILHKIARIPGARLDN